MNPATTLKVARGIELRLSVLGTSSITAVLEPVRKGQRYPWLVFTTAKPCECHVSIWETDISLWIGGASFYLSWPQLEQVRAAFPEFRVDDHRLHSLEVA